MSALIIYMDSEKAEQLKRIGGATTRGANTTCGNPLSKTDYKPLRSKSGTYLNRVELSTHRKRRQEAPFRKYVFPDPRKQGTVCSEYCLLIQTDRQMRIK